MTTLQFYVAIIICIFIQSAILYFIIKAAVLSATKGIKDKLESQNKMMAKQLMDSGLSRTEAINLAFNPESPV
jgi:hypothetical protein